MVSWMDVQTVQYASNIARGLSDASRLQNLLDVVSSKPFWFRRTQVESTIRRDIAGPGSGQARAEMDDSIFVKFAKPQ